MKKIFGLILIVSVLFSLFLLFGCGQTHSSTPIPSALSIVSRYPVSGTVVASNSAITLTFNNVINISQFNFYKISGSLSHTPEVQTGAITWEWTADHKTITIEGVSRYYETTSTEAPVKVILRDYGAFKDVNGDKLTTGETLVNYSMPIEWERYYPDFRGLHIEYAWLETGPSATGDTYEVQDYYDECAAYPGFSTFEDWYSPVTAPYTSYVSTKNNCFRSIMNGGETPASYEGGSGMTMFTFPLTVGFNYTGIATNDTGMGAVLITAEVLGNEHVSTLIGSFNAINIHILMTLLDAGGAEINTHQWLVYNRGSVKSEMILPLSFAQTSEVTKWEIR